MTLVGGCHIAQRGNRPETGGIEPVSRAQDPDRSVTSVDTGDSRSDNTTSGHTVGNSTAQALSTATIPNDVDLQPDRSATRPDGRQTSLDPGTQSTAAGVVVEAQDSASPRPVNNTFDANYPAASFEIDKLVAHPTALGLCGPTRVRFTVSVVRLIPAAWPNYLELVEVDENTRAIHMLGRLAKHPNSHPIVASYEGEVWVSPSAERTMDFQARATIDGIEYVSQGLAQVAATRFPIDDIPSAVTVVTRDPESDERFIANELLVSFKSGTPPGRVQEIVAFEGAEVLKKLDPSQQVFKLQVLGGDTVLGLRQAAAGFEDYHHVEHTRLNPAVADR